MSDLGIHKHFEAGHSLYELKPFTKRDYGCFAEIACQYISLTA